MSVVELWPFWKLVNFIVKSSQRSINNKTNIEHFGLFLPYGNYDHHSCYHYHSYCDCISSKIYITGEITGLDAII